MSAEVAAREALAMVEEAKASGNGSAPPDAIAAAEELAEILGLPTVGLAVRGARVVGRGGGASADIYLSDGSALTFERLRDAGKPGALAIEVAACTGATPKLTGPLCLRVLSLLRAVAEHETVFDGDQVAREWGTSFLQEATVLDLDMADQRERWGAFNELAAKLDAARSSDAAASATAAPQLAKQLVDVVAALRPDGAEPDALDDLRRRRGARLLALANRRNGQSGAVQRRLP